MTSARTTHRCPGGCVKQVASHMLACRAHWYTVTPATRSRVWRAFQNSPGSPEHLDAMFDAIQEMNARV